jgi:photosystem II stability/assembly factor-like uncharacterized protein
MLFAPFPLLAQGTWEKLDVPVNQSLTSVFFTDSVTGWAAGDSGVIIHTSDGGTSWVVQNSNTIHDIADIFFLDSLHGRASAFNYQTEPYGTVLLETSDGGLNWSAGNYPHDNIFITSIFFFDTLNGWMGGKPHTLVRTTDGGLNWTQAVIDTSILAFFPVLEVGFYNARYGYACGGMFDIAGVIWRTSDGGETWYAIDPADAPADEVHSLYYIDSVNVVGAGGDPDFGYGVGLIRTRDGGLNWDYTELGMQGVAMDLDFRNGKEGWAPLGLNRSMMYTLDSGLTWTEIPSPGGTTVYEITFPDSLHGYVVGASGTVLRYKPPVTGISDPGAWQAGVILLGNSPNPFSSNTVIRVRFPGYPVNGGNSRAVRSVIAEVYDMPGNLVARTAEFSVDRETLEIPFAAGQLDPGIYFYRLICKTDDGGSSASAPGRMVILR